MSQAVTDMRVRLKALTDALAVADHDTATRELASFDHLECRAAWGEVFAGNTTIALDFIELCDDALSAAGQCTPPVDTIFYDRFIKNQDNIRLRKGYADLLLRSDVDTVIAQMDEDRQALANRPTYVRTNP